MNAANSSLLGGGGVDGAIHRAGGPSILAECRLLRFGPSPREGPIGQEQIGQDDDDLQDRQDKRTIGQDAARYPQGLPAGQAAATDAGDLSVRRVIHAVGPVWHGGSQGEAELLASAYRSSLALAAREGLSDIAFPAISTGAYGYPKGKAARVAFATVAHHLSAHSIPRTVHLVFYSEADACLFLDSLEGLAPFRDPMHGPKKVNP